MKKFFLFILCLALCAVFVPSVAEEKPVQFNGIPWGSSPKTAIDIMQRTGYPAGYEDVSEADSLPMWTYDFRHVYEHYVSGAGYRQYSGYYDTDAKVAGHQINGIEMCYFCDYTTGAILDEQESSHLYMVEVGFAVDDDLVVAAYNDLDAKLTSLYGSGTPDTFYSVETSYSLSEWKDSTGATVCLYRSENDDGKHKYLHLLYGAPNINENLEEMHRVFIATQDMDASDVTGL